MQLLKVLIFICLIYGTTARNWFDFVEPYIRQLIEQHRGKINNHCESFIESNRDFLRTGSPALGIEPIDPLYISRFEIPLGTADITILDGELRGISDFDIEYCDLKIFGLYASIRFDFRNLSIVGKHETTMKAGSITYTGSGDAEISLTGVNVEVGVDLDVIDDNRLNLNDFIFDLDVDDVEIHFTGFGLGSAVDKVLSEILGGAMEIGLDQGDVLFEVLFAGLKYPVNQVLNGFKMPDVIARIVEFIRGYN